MKKLILLALVATIAFTSCEKAPLLDDSFSSDLVTRRGADDVAQPAPSGLPSAVSAAFKAAYPTATRIEWEPENGGTWKVKFFIGGQRMRALYSASGSLLWVRND